MSDNSSFIKGKKILAVDDEKDVLDTVKEILNYAYIDCADSYETAYSKIQNNKYDIVLLDIMGVDGMKLLEKAVEKNYPTVIFSANAVNPDILMNTIKKGAICFIQKEYINEIDILLNKILGAHKRGEPSWKLLFSRLDDYFTRYFGESWRDKHKDFWDNFEDFHNISKGLQERLKHNKKIINKGI